MKGFYQERILPHLVAKVCASGDLMDLRRTLVPQATGIVLEVGMGSGINLELYNPGNVTMVYGLEPSEGMRRQAQKTSNARPCLSSG